MGSNPATPTKKPPEKDFLRRGSKKREISYGEKYCSGCSAVRLARQLRELEVAGSNPVSPTNCKRFRMRNLILNLFCLYPALYRPGARFRSLFGRNIRIGSGHRRSCFACRTGCFRSFFRRLRPVRPQWDLCPSPYPLPCRFPPLLCRGGCGHVSNPPEHSRRYPASVTASDSVFSSVSAPASYSVSVLSLIHI